MVIIVVSLIPTAFFFLAGLFYRNKRKYITPTCLCLGLVGLSLLVFVSVLLFGVGIVPFASEEFTTRLNAGRVYQVVAVHVVDDSTNDKGERIILVREIGTSGYRAIRVNVPGRLPETFTLIDGRPVEVVLAPSTADN